MNASTNGNVEDAFAKCQNGHRESDGAGTRQIRPSVNASDPIFFLFVFVFVFVFFSSFFATRPERVAF